MVGWNIDVALISPAGIGRGQHHVYASPDRGEQYAIATDPAQSRGVSHKQLRFLPSQQRQFVGVPGKRTFYLREVHPAAVLRETDGLFSKGCLSELERFAVG